MTTQSARMRPFGAGGPLVYGIVVIVVVITVGPVLYGALGGFRSNEQIARDPAGLPDPWVWGNYGEILGSGTFWRQVWNSTLIAVVSTLLTVPLAALAAFVGQRAGRGLTALMDDISTLATKLDQRDDIAVLALEVADPAR